jgi:hypothetical protein
MSDKIVVDGRIADGLHDIAEAIRELASEIRIAGKMIGQGDSITPGALEFIGMQMRDGIKLRIEAEDVVKVSIESEE